MLSGRGPDSGREFNGGKESTGFRRLTVVSLYKRFLLEL